MITKCLFADDGALLAPTRSGAKTVVCAYQQVTSKQWMNSISWITDNNNG